MCHLSIKLLLRHIPQNTLKYLLVCHRDRLKSYSCILAYYILISHFVHQVEAEAEIKRLKERCMILESRSSSYVAIGDETARGTFTELNRDINEFMYLIGGYDGTQSLSALDCYTPSLDTVKSLQPMNSERSYAAVANLNGEIYVFGGGSGSLCYDTGCCSYFLLTISTFSITRFYFMPLTLVLKPSVEAYHPANNTWKSRPSLNKVMGSLAGATVNNKLFALGGGDGHESFSDVEMLDLDAGRWIPTQSMRHKVIVFFCSCFFSRSLQFYKI